jgi:hypothetical protein
MTKLASSHITARKESGVWHQLMYQLLWQPCICAGMPALPALQQSPCANTTRCTLRDACHHLDLIIIIIMLPNHLDLRIQPAIKLPGGHARQ